MSRTLGELAHLVGGILAGDAQTVIERALPLGLAGPGDITLIDGSEKSRKLAGSCTASAVVVGEKMAIQDVLPAGVAILEVADFHASFTAIVRSFRAPRERRPLGISPRAFISPSAQIAADVDIYPGATIADDVEIGAGSIIHAGVYVGPGCRIGRGVTIFPNAVLYEDVVVGDRSILHACVVLGAHGFGYRQVGEQHILTQQLGWVEIGCDVEIGAGTTIDRGTYGPTVIGDGTKIDDQVMIGHNCRVGRHNLICAQVGLAGSTTSGDYVVMAGQVGVRDHVHIGDRAILGAKSGIMNDVEPGASMMGSPASNQRTFWLQMAAVSRLPELRHEIRALEREVAELRTRLASPESAPHENNNRHAA